MTAVCRVKVGGLGAASFLDPWGVSAEGLPTGGARVGGIAGEGRRRSALPFRLAPGGAGCRCGRAPGPRGCEERPRAAGGSVGPGGARQRAVMSVAARLAAAGTSCIKAGGPGCDSREPGQGCGRQAAAAERWQGCHRREPGSWRFPRPSLPSPRDPGGVDICGAESWMYARARAGTEEWQCSNSATR